MRTGLIILPYMFALSALLFNKPLSAQFIDPREAKEHFRHHNYAAAIGIYDNLLQKDRNNPEYNYEIGLCYLNSNIDKKRAISYLEKTVKQPKFDNEALFHLGLAYQYAHRFDDAINTYTKYKKIAGGANLDKVDRKIETCGSAKDLIRSPVDVVFENLGSDINTKYPDYYPFVAKDESYIVFTSRRGGVLEFDGFYQSDIFISENSGNNFSKAVKGPANINSDFDDQAVGLSDDANMLFVYFDNIKEVGNIYISERESKRFSNLVKLGENVNSTDLETSASISADGNTLFFTSNRSGGEGGLDLYMSRKLPSDEWGLPQNLGPKVNTKYNEDFPTLSADGQTLYFCSEGHKSMGGYDIFVSTWDPEANSWSKPINIGYPINDAMDNRTISFSENGKNAYFSALRSGGMGDLDIYRIKFAVDFIIRLRLPTSSPETPFIKDASVSVDNPVYEQPLAFTANQKTGFYTIVIKKPGVYTLTIEAVGYKIYTEEINLAKDVSDDVMISKTVNLIPQ